MKHLTREDLIFLSKKIAEAERHTLGEIRVVLRHRRHWRERKLSLHELALREFRRLGMGNTSGRTGVLVLLLLSERSFQIIADEGIHRHVPEGTWESIASAMSERFRNGNFRDGLAHAVDRAGEELARYVPGERGGRNQLPDEVIEE
jgi:uncharacterized membrane protein